MVEILLIRVFDAILSPDLAYTVITCALFAFGLAGVYSAIWPPSADRPGQQLARLSLLFSLSLLLLRPALNAIASLFVDTSTGDSDLGFARFALVFLVLLVPFFLSGLIFAQAFSQFSSHIRTLYFWDLFGAALGCVAFLPFLREIGPGGLLFVAAAVALAASGLFSRRRGWSAASALVALALLIVPFARPKGHFSFTEHMDKRGVASARRDGRVELTEWDPISKIDVVARGSRHKQVAYDGGMQSSTLFRFDGDYAALRRTLLEPAEPLGWHFWHRGVAASHYLKRDTGAEVLIIGSAAGQETKAALLFNPSRVEGIEMVRTVVELGKATYADFIGRIFSDPRVDNRVGEGRSYLRNTDKMYDIIQIFSNHTSSATAVGKGAGFPVYLQTVEAYVEYFSRLRPDGILHVNHHFYPRTIVTAAEAWRRLGRADFRRHVAVFERQGITDTLPTLLVKMSPWTAAEVAEIVAYFAIEDSTQAPQRMVVDPTDPTTTFLSDDIFTGQVSEKTLESVDYLLRPPSDDRPFFNIISKPSFGLSERAFEEDPERLLNLSMASQLTWSHRKWGFPHEYRVFAVPGAVGILFVFVLVFLPLRVANVGKARWHGEYLSLAYFSLLGGAFIIIELVLVQVFMQLIGFPLAAYSAVIFTILFAAGLGSASSQRIDVRPDHRWWLPFAGVLAAGLLLWFGYPRLIGAALALPLVERVGAAAAAIFPLGFFLGMPFPLGVLTITDKPKGAVAWAWGANGTFTVLGGVASGVLAAWIGYRTTLLLGIVAYVVAFLVYSQLRRPPRRPAV